MPTPLRRRPVLATTLPRLLISPRIRILLSLPPRLDLPQAPTAIYVVPVGPVRLLRLERPRFRAALVVTQVVLVAEVEVGLMHVDLLGYQRSLGLQYLGTIRETLLGLVILADDLLPLVDPLLQLG